MTDLEGAPGVPAEVPDCPEGWSTGPPDFVGVGADRSGTTRWHRLIVSHPEVSAAPGAGKELHFFDAFWDGSFRPTDPERYQRYFPREPGCIAGEWTPRYMYDVWTPGLLARCAPETKVLISLRDPLERYRSHLRTAVARTGTSRFLGRAAAIALSRSLYADPLARVLAHFDPEQVLVLQMERSVDEPAPDLRRTFEFLGVDPDFEPPNASARVNEGPVGVNTPPVLEADIKPTFTEDARRLAELVPDFDPSLWPSINR